MNEIQNHRCHHARITTIMPLTDEQIAILRWVLDYCEFLRLSGSEQASYDYANDVATWHADDPQCARLWSGSKQECQPDDWTPWNGDFGEVEPEWNREGWVGA